MNFLNNRWILLALAALALIACKERDTHYEYFDDANSKPKKIFQVDKENGKMDGSYKEFRENGNLYLEGTFKDGSRNGTFREYREDGSLLMENNYKDDVIEGIVKVYNRDKKLVSKGEIKDGSYVHQKFFTDPRDGKNYPVVAIGSRIWMAANLNFYTSGSLCYGNKDEYCDKYGRLYTWYEAAEACPDGWDLPNYDEVNTLMDAVGGSAVAGRMLKSASGWYIKDWQKSGYGNDAYGFSALPGGSASMLLGSLVFDGVFDEKNRSAQFWMSTENEYNEDNAYRLGISTYLDNAYVISISKASWHSVRCIKDVD